MAPRFMFLQLLAAMQYVMNIYFDCLLNRLAIDFQ